MEQILKSYQMKAADDYTINYYGVPSLVLMERAALCTVEEIEKIKEHPSHILVVCGSGNNGGDGFAIARLFAEKKIACDVYFTGEEEHMSDSAYAELQICKKYDIKFVCNPNYHDYDCIVDAMFGVGLNRLLSDKYISIIDSINEKKNINCLVASVDIPTGINADNGKIMGAAIIADLTVTYAYKKLGHILYPGCEYSGQVVRKNIGITYEKANSLADTEYYALDDTDFPCVKRKKYSNKGTYGKALIIAGSADTGGCALLAAKACFSCGSGMVRIYTHINNRDFIINSLPEAMIDTYDECIDYDRLEKAMQWSDAAVIGPGISVSDIGKELTEYVIDNYEKPLIVDADSLTNISLSEREKFDRDNVIITPHIGELSRVLNIDKKDILDNLIESAILASNKLNCVCVLKDSRTITASDDKKVFINLSGNDGMAVAGSGDALTGIICALLCQGLNRLDAASCGVYLHGRAGDIAVKKSGRSAMLPSDLINSLNYYFE